MSKGLLLKLIIIVSLWSVYITVMQVPIHEAVHAYQCRAGGGTAKFVIIDSNGYDFLRFSFLPALPSPAIECTGGTFTTDNWDAEWPAFLLGGIYQFGFTIIFALFLRNYGNKNQWGRGGVKPRCPNDI